MAYNSGYWEELERSLRKQLAEVRAENAALVAEFQRLADEPPTLEEIAADLNKIEMLGKELAEARAEIERLKAEIRDNNYLAARQIVPAEMAVDDLHTEIERQTDRIMSDACIISAAALAIAEAQAEVERLALEIENQQ